MVRGPEIYRHFIFGDNVIFFECYAFAQKYQVRIPPRRGVLDTTLCDKFCQLLAAGGWFSPNTPVSSTSKPDRHDITEILLKVA